MGTGLFLVMVYVAFIRSYLIKYGYPYPIRRGLDYSGGFIAGSLLAFLDIEKIKYKKIIVLLMIVTGIISLQLYIYALVQYIVLPLSVILIGTASTPVVNKLKHSIGDMSYGIYIYAFPVQQTLEHFFRLNTVPLMLWSAVATAPFAWLSWHFIEKKALSKKVRFTNRM